MRKNSVESNNDSQVRWWWPGYWLRIVFSVWFDQLWYWKNIRPLIASEDTKTRKDIFLSSVFGTLLCISIIVVFFELLGIEVKTKILGLIVVINSIFILFGAYMMFTNAPNMHSLGEWSIPYFVVLGITVSCAILIGLQFFQLLGLLTGLVTGISLGMSLGIVKISRPNIRETLLSGVAVGFFLSAMLVMVSLLEVNILMTGIVTTIAHSLSYFLCGLWATRQDIK